jgi:hypothetical protein
MLPRQINDLTFFGCQRASPAPNSVKGDVCQNPFNVLILLCNFLAAPDRVAAESTRRIDRHLLLWVSLSQ